MRGYVYIHRIGTGEYEAVGYDWQGYIITSPTWSKEYKKAYMKIYNQLKVRKRG